MGKLQPRSVTRSHRHASVTHVWVVHGRRTLGFRQVQRAAKGTSGRVGLLRQRLGAAFQSLGVVNRIGGFREKTVHVR